jgi:hypothetical protein
MAKTTREREDDERAARLEQMRAQIESGDLTIRQMTAEERARWDDHSAAADRQATPDDRARREAARRTRARRDEMRKRDES